MDEIVTLQLVSPNGQGLLAACTIIAKEQDYQLFLHIRYLKDRFLFKEHKRELIQNVAKAVCEAFGERAYVLVLDVISILWDAYVPQLKKTTKSRGGGKKAEAARAEESIR